MLLVLLLKVSNTYKYEAVFDDCSTIYVILNYETKKVKVLDFQVLLFKFMLFLSRLMIGFYLMFP